MEAGTRHADPLNLPWQNQRLSAGRKFPLPRAADISSQRAVDDPRVLGTPHTTVRVVPWTRPARDEYWLQPRDGERRLKQLENSREDIDEKTLTRYGSRATMTPRVGVD